jgi:hypothetical protein
MRISQYGKNIPLNKNEKNYKWYVTSCLTKKRFSTMEEAILFASKFRMRFNGYKCTFCGGYHLTTHGPNRDYHRNFIIQDKNGKNIDHESSLAFKTLCVARRKA